MTRIWEEEECDHWYHNNCVVLDDKDYEYLTNKVIGNSRSEIPDREFPGIGAVAIPAREFPEILKANVCQN